MENQDHEYDEVAEIGKNTFKKIFWVEGIQFMRLHFHLLLLSKIVVVNE